MDKRYLSMSSLNTDLSDLSIHDPRSPSPAQASANSSEQGTSHLPRKSPIGGEWPLSSHYNAFQSGPPATQSPYRNATPLPPMNEDGNGEGMLQPPPPVTQIPQRMGSPNGSRPTSVVGAGSRPASRDFSGSQGGSRPGSRVASPSKFHRPSTPGAEKKLKKRRSWLPGKSTFEPADGSDGESLPQAWIVTPNEKINYDLDPLIHFQKVRILTP